MVSIHRYWTTCILLCVLVVAPSAPGQCDPQELVKLVAADAGASEYFGVSVALDGDTVIVGAYGDDDDDLGWTDSGSAYVFVRSEGVWMEQAKLTVPDPYDYDYLGYSVALDGDTAVIGAYQRDPGAVENAGAAYVFVRSAEVWTLEAELTASDAAEDDWFGFSVALAGDTAVIGAHLDDRANKTDGGAAYVFVRSGDTWSQQAKLSSSDAAAYDYFGRSVSLYGDTAVIGAPGADLAGADGAGAAYVFVRSGPLWTQQAKLTASDAAAYDNFGFSVVTGGDMALIGAIYDDHASGNNAGSAYVFVRSSGAWAQQAKLISSDAAPSDVFGRSVATLSETVIVGANQDDHAGGYDAGSAYVFARSDSVWLQQAQLLASDAAASNFFGSAVAADNSMVLIGAVYDDHVGGPDAGAAYLFSVGCGPGDLDQDGDVDLADFATFSVCFRGSGNPIPAEPPECALADLDQDEDADIGDFTLFAQQLMGPLP